MEDIIKLIVIYPGDSTADHIMKGSAYYKTLRSHYITENGAASTFDETELSSNAFEHIRNQGRTAVLWLQYMGMIKIIFYYIRAQRTSDITLHLTSTRSASLLHSSWTSPICKRCQTNSLVIRCLDIIVP